MIKTSAPGESEINLLLLLSDDEELSLCLAPDESVIFFLVRLSFLSNNPTLTSFLGLEDFLGCAFAYPNSSSGVLKSLVVGIFCSILFKTPVSA